MLKALPSAILGALVLVWICVGGAFAGTASFPELSDVLPGKIDTTYADLVRLVVPSAVGSGTPADDDAPRVRHIEGGYDITLGSGDFRGFAAVSVRSGGLDRIALLLDLGEPEYAVGSAVLALFDVSDEPVLLDAVDVAFDRTTFLAKSGALPAGLTDDLLVLFNTHHNTGQSYNIAALILVHNDRFEMVDSIFMLGERNCAYNRTQSFDIHLEPREPFADMVVTIADEAEEVPYPECGNMRFPIPETREITVTYHWDGVAGKYVPDSDAFVRLARENEERL